MRRLLFALALIVLTVPAMPSSSHSRSHTQNSYGNGLSVSFDDWSDVRDCSSLQVRNNGQSVPVIEEDVPVGAVRSLKVRSDRNGGIRVMGSSARGYSVKACKASMFGNARDLRVNVSGDEVSADVGDDDRRSIVYFLVFTPRGASVDLSATNGPISIEDVDGTIVAAALNGPIGLKGCTGTMDIHTQNGPIGFDGNSGSVKLRATNGPISVKLTGSGWGSGNLDAQTENGPMALKLPRNYGSAVLVTTDGNSPVSCRAVACSSARKTFRSDDDDDMQRWPRKIELGSGAQSVTLSTHNGPVAIKEGD